MVGGGRGELARSRARSGGGVVILLPRLASCWCCARPAGPSRAIKAGAFGFLSPPLSLSAPALPLPSPSSPLAADWCLPAFPLLLRSVVGAGRVPTPARELHRASEVQAAAAALPGRPAPSGILAFLGSESRRRSPPRGWRRGFDSRRFLQIRGDLGPWMARI